MKIRLLYCLLLISANGYSNSTISSYSSTAGYSLFNQFRGSTTGMIDGLYAGGNTSCAYNLVGHSVEDFMQLDVELDLVDKNICENTALVTLSGGSPVGGIYSGTGVTANEFVPADAGVGVHEITYTYTDVNGCTGTAVDTITIIQSSEVIVTQVGICEEDLPFEWNGILVYETGIYTDAYIDVNGCDAYEELFFTILINTPNNTELKITPEELPFIWNGMELYESGSYTFYIEGEGDNCDYEETLTLIVESSVSNAELIARKPVGLFPNPVHDQLNIVSEIELDLVLYNSMGSQVLKTRLEKGQNTLSTAYYTNGIYYLQFSEKGRSWSELIVIEQ